MTISVEASDRHRRLNERLRRVLELPLDEQAHCVLLAAEMALPVWRAFEERNGLSGMADHFLGTARSWLAGDASDEDLEAASKPLEVALPKDFTKSADPAAGMAGFALVDVKMLGLDQCEDVHDNILFTSICYAAAAACGGSVSPASLGWNTLSEPQLDLLERWWARCLETVSGLV